MKNILKNKLSLSLVLVVTALSLFMTIDIAEHIYSDNDIIITEEICDDSDSVSVEYYQVVNKKNSDIKLAPYRKSN